MSDKSYVTMAQHICPICGEIHETGELLLDKRLREVFDMHTITGWGMCPKCHEKVDEGYVAFVELAQEPTAKGRRRGCAALRLSVSTGRGYWRGACCGPRGP